MYQMVLLIVSNTEQCPSVLDAWDSAGVGGITILESTGMGKVRQASIRDDVPLMPSLSRLFQHREIRHRTIFTVVDSDEMVDRLIEVTEERLGDLNNPDNGVMFILPVSRVVGFAGAKKRANKE
jgi:nitrogen regulatory protein P-II 1